MHEAMLRAFLEGRCSAVELRANLVGAVLVDGIFRQHLIEDMDDDFEVRAEHLVRVCDAVLAGNIEPESLQAIGFYWVASDHFDWDAGTLDGEAVSMTALDWSAPKINYALNLENTRMFRDRLQNKETN